jgi:hypothetical protein
MSIGWREVRGLVAEMAIWLGLAATAFALTFEFAGEAGSYRWGAASWPRAIVVAIAAGAVAQFLLRLRARARLAARPGASPEPAAAWDADLMTSLSLAAALGLPLLYVLLMPRAGFYATTPPFLAAYLYLLGERRVRFLVGVPLLIYALVMLIFSSLFYVALPTGTWPGFYDFSNWLLVLVR